MLTFSVFLTRIVFRISICAISRFMENLLLLYCDVTFYKYAVAEDKRRLTFSNVSSSGQTLIHLIDRKTGKEVETKYYTGAVVVYHHVNAYEEDGHVIFDVIAYKDNSLYNMFYISKLKENAGFHDEAYSKPSYKRFVLPLQSDKVGFFSFPCLVLSLLCIG